MVHEDGRTEHIINSPITCANDSALHCIAIADSIKESLEFRERWRLRTKTFINFNYRSAWQQHMIHNNSR